MNFAFAFFFSVHGRLFSLLSVPLQILYIVKLNTVKLMAKSPCLCERRDRTLEARRRACFFHSLHSLSTRHHISPLDYSLYLSRLLM